MAIRNRVRSGTHLRLRGRVWWYRRDVPKDARNLFGCTAVWKSLDTSDENEAKRLEKAEDVKFERRLGEARDSADPEKRRSHAVAAFIEGVPAGSIRVLDIQRGGAGIVGYIASDAVHEEDQHAVGDGIKLMLQERFAQQSKVSELLQEIAAIMPGLSQDAWERCQRDMLSIARHYTSPTPGTTPTVVAPEICFWGLIFDTWESEMKPASKTVYSWKRIVRKLVAHLARDPNLTVEQAMAWNAAAITEKALIEWKNSVVHSIGPTTIKNHLTIFRTMYNYASDNKLLPRSVAEGVKQVKHKAKKRPGTRQLGYTDDDARAILTSARQQHDPVLRWAPWLAATLGTRIDEICGAMVADIEVDHDDIAWFNVRLDYRDTDPNQAPEIKSENAERKLPIHRALWQGENFAGYVAGLGKDSPLFAALKADSFGRRGGNGSKRVQRWVRNKIGITDKRKGPSHAWRHRFRSIVRNPKYGISEDVADYMAGHGGDGGEGRHYGEYRDAMIVAISRLPPPLPPYSAK